MLGFVLTSLFNLEAVTAPRGFSAADLIGLSVAAPLLETLLLWPLLVYFPARSEFCKALVCGILWGGVHALARGPIGLGVTLAFGIFSVVFLRVRNVNGSRVAVVATTIIHALHNITLIGLAYLISG